MVNYWRFKRLKMLLRTCSQAEAVAVVLALFRGESLGRDKIVFEGDCLNVIQLLNGFKSTENWRANTIIDATLNLLASHKSWKVKCS